MMKFLKFVCWLTYFEIACFTTTYLHEITFVQEQKPFSREAKSFIWGAAWPVYWSIQYWQEVIHESDLYGRLSEPGLRQRPGRDWCGDDPTRSCGPDRDGSEETLPIPPK